MHYKAAYLYLFSFLTDLIKLLESTTPDCEQLNIPVLLRCAQVTAEEQCTD